MHLKLPNGKLVPRHFHVTEVGKLNNHFIDCGGTVRQEEVISLQLWEENDYDHRLHPEKLLHIIELSEKVLRLENLNIEVEYQNETIGKYGLDFNGTEFLLINTKTDCLAKTNCGISNKKEKVALSDINSNATACCTPNSGCC